MKLPRTGLRNFRSPFPYARVNAPEYSLSEGGRQLEYKTYPGQLSVTVPAAAIAFAIVGWEELHGSVIGPVGQCANCGGVANDGVKTALLNCTKKCDDPDNCICASSCIKANQEIVKEQDCGGDAQQTTTTVTTTVGCNVDDWKLKCSECSQKDPNGNPYYDGIFCINNKWMCTTNVNIGQNDYHSLSECPT